MSFLRALFAPLGIAMIDASHPATRAAAAPVLSAALEKAGDIAAKVYIDYQALRAVLNLDIAAKGAGTNQGHSETLIGV